MPLSDSSDDDENHKNANISDVPENDCLDSHKTETMPLVKENVENENVEKTTSNDNANAKGEDEPPPEKDDELYDKEEEAREDAEAGDDEDGDDSGGSDRSADSEYDGDEEESCHDESENEWESTNSDVGDGTEYETCDSEEGGTQEASYDLAKAEYRFKNKNEKVVVLAVKPITE